jgi:hypothetical protein
MQFEPIHSKPQSNESFVHLVSHSAPPEQAMSHWPLLQIYVPTQSSHASEHMPESSSHVTLQVVFGPHLPEQTPAVHTDGAHVAPQTSH